jgi:Tol biopolymer transport system component
MIENIFRALFVPALALAGACVLSAQQPAECSNWEMRRIGRVGPGHDWSPAGDLIALALPHSSGFTQLYTMKPDGSDLRCLSCSQVAGGPSVGVHKGVVHWHSSGRYLFLQVEMEDHPGDSGLSYPGRGRYNDIWATTPDGSRWWRLTNYSSNRETGVLFPIPSPDGKKLAWAERYTGPRNPYQTLATLLRGRPTKEVWGIWRLNIADLLFDAAGNPRLANTRHIGVGDSVFYETQGWSPRSDAIYFAADIARSNPYLLDIFRMDLNTRGVVAVTNDARNWEEHIGVSPGGRKVTIMSSKCCSVWNPDDLRTLRAELYLADSDGSNEIQLTRFNTPGTPDYAEGGSVVTRSVWSPDGRQVLFGRGIISAFEDTGELWLLTFAGACGR